MYICFEHSMYEMGGRWKSQNRKKVYLSPYVEEPLNSKVIKSFVPELRSRKCFSCFGFQCSMYICYEHSMYVSHISYHWYGTNQQGLTCHKNQKIPLMYRMITLSLKIPKQKKMLNLALHLIIIKVKYCLIIL